MWIVNYVMIVVCSSLIWNLGCVLDISGNLDELELLSCDVLALICCAFKVMQTGTICLHAWFVDTG